MKKKPVKAAEVAQPFYVGVQNPADVRKAMLETSRDLLLSLKQYEHLKALRTKKMALYSQVHAQISTLKSLLARLQRAVPKHDVAPLLAKPKEVAPVATPKPVAVEKPARVAAMDEVTRLEAELAEIEKKLSGL